MGGTDGTIESTSMRRSNARMLFLAGMALTLLLAIAASAAAGPEATTAVSKKKVKKIARKLDDKQDRQRFPLGTGDLANGAVTSSKLAAGAVNSAKVADDSLTGEDIASQGVGGGEIADGAVTNSKLGGNSVNSAKVSDRSLGTSEFANSIPAARVHRSDNQSIPVSADTPLAFNKARYDTADMHSTSTDNSRVYAPVEGIYELSASVQWSADATGSRDLFLRRNGSTTLIVDNERPGAAVPVFSNVSTVVRLAKGDYVEVVVIQSSGGSLDVISEAEYSPEFSMTWLAPGP